MESRSSGSSLSVRAPTTERYLAENRSSHRPTTPAGAIIAVGDRRASAIAKTLTWADEAAAEEDYAAALFLLRVVDEAFGLSAPYRLKHGAWTRSALV
jgi:hypothetical protein